MDFRSYELRIIPEAKRILEFTTSKDLIAATVGNGPYIYYKRYSQDKFYRLREEELSFMHLAGEEIPF